MGGTRSELQQPVAGLFSTSRPERKRRALPLLRELRPAVAAGGSLLASISALPVTIDREFARSELTRVFPVVSLDVVDLWGDTELRLWFIDKAIRACGALHRGGHHVTRRVA